MDSIRGLTGMFTLADDSLIYKQAIEAHAAVITVQEQLENVSQGCYETGSEISPSKVQAL